MTELELMDQKQANQNLRLSSSLEDLHNQVTGIARDLTTKAGVTELAECQSESLRLDSLLTSMATRREADNTTHARTLQALQQQVRLDCGA